MAVVRITSFTRNKPQIKGTIRYIVHRAGAEGEKLTRNLFDGAGPSTKARAYELIDNAPKGTIFFRLVINPDPKREDRLRDLDMVKLTRKTLISLEKQMNKQLQFIATMHADHSPKRHIHAIVMAQARIDKPILANLRESATHEAVNQRKMLDLFLRLEQKRLRIRRTFRMAGGRGEREHKLHEYRGVKFTRPSCFDCGGNQRMYRLRDGRLWCPSCQKVRERSIGLSL